MPDIIIHYPGGWNYYPGFVDHVTPVEENFLNGIGFAFYSIEYALGSDPQGGYGTVRGRFENVESSVSDLKDYVDSEVADLETSIATKKSKRFTVPVVAEYTGGAAKHISNVFGAPIDQAGEYCYTYAATPSDCTGVKKIRVYGQAVGADVEGMRLRLYMSGAKVSEVWNAESVDVTKNSTAGTVIGEIVTWEFDVTDDPDIEDIGANEALLLQPIYAAAADSRIATNAYITCVEIEYY